MDLRGDNRGQAEVIGAVLIFSIVLLLLSANQVFLVPNKNAEIEHKHSQTIQKDMVTFRTGLIEAAASNEPRSVDLTVGANYPTRHIAINPPPISGSIRTVDGGTYQINRGSGLDNICGTQPTAKFIEYQANYNEMQGVLPIQHENTFQYRQGQDNILLDTGQVLIRGTQITIIPIKGDLSQSTSSEISVDILPAPTGRSLIEPDGSGDPVILTVPSQIDHQTWEDDILADEMTNGNVMGVSDSGQNEVSIQLQAPESGGDSPDRYTIRCTAVGFNQEPDVTSVPDIGDGSEDNISGGINPCCHSVSWVRSEPDDSNVTATFENHLNFDVQVTSARFVYYSEEDQGNNQGGGNFDPPDWAKYGDEHYRITGEAREPGDGDMIDAGDTADFEIQFAESETDLEPGNPNQFTVADGDWFVLRLTFEEVDGDEQFTATYFIPTNSAAGN